MLGPTIISDEDGSFRLQRSNQNKGNGAWDTVPEDIPFRKFPKEMPLRRTKGLQYFQLPTPALHFESMTEMDLGEAVHPAFP